MRYAHRLSGILLLLGFLSFSVHVHAQTGKIAGRVLDEAGQPLPGATVAIEGTTRGSTADVDGYYAIVGVKPGTYAVRASFVGFTPQLQQSVRVNIDLTTEVDFELSTETVGLEEVVVQAEMPVVQRDVSASVANISAGEVENLPMASIGEVIGVQAGAEGLNIRGGGLDELSFQVDGLSLRTGRDNVPFTGISYTAIDEVQVQTGGFNAEYGNVRSGLVNVVLKEGSADRYSADVILRYAPDAEGYYEIRPDDPSAYWIRPYVDPEVALEGTGAWPEPLRRQYPEFDGWVQVAENVEGLTPEQAREVFAFRHRKDLAVETPAYDVDATVTGPVPGLSRPLGDLRFTASYRQTQAPYFIPMRRDAFTQQVGQFKLTSDLRTGMKLSVQGLLAREEGMAGNDSGNPGILDPTCARQGRSAICNGRPPARGNGMERSVLFGLDVLGLSDVETTLFGAEFTHTLSASTFYEIRLQRNGISYLTRPGPERDPTVIQTVGGVELNEAPFGYQQQPEGDFSGLALGAGQWVNGRDSSDATIWTARADLTSQVNRFALVKAGVEAILSDYDTRQRNVGFFTPGNVYNWSRQPTQGAAYAQTKLEFRGLVANLGLRLDYFHGGGAWYVHSPFDRAFSPRFGFNELDEALEREDLPRELFLSPRLGVAFPVTEHSKFFLNYGHFRSALDPTQAFAIRGNLFDQRVTTIGNPYLPLPQTVSYELGFEQNLFDQLLLRTTGYYRASEDQPRGVRFVSIDGLVDYTIPLPDNYNDVRGFELTLSKNRGRWVQGFVNYTYMVFKGGNFGYNVFFENRVEQRRFEERANNLLNRPDPRPYANFNVALLLPQDFGPKVGGLNPLGDWRVSLLGYWRQSGAFSWDGGRGDLIAEGLVDNVRWTPVRRLDLRFAKNVNAGGRDVRLFADVENVLGLKRLYQDSFALQSEDYIDYMTSLHLPADVFGEFDAPYPFIPGDDQPGDYRVLGAPFTPIEIVDALPETGARYDLDELRGPLYFVLDACGEGQSFCGGTYYEWDGAGFVEARQNFVDEVLDERQYIDMPNEQYYWFVDPRRVRFGLQISL